MSDERIRGLERRWKESGRVEDEAAYLQERLRAGELTRDHVELAARLGHAAARELFPEAVRFGTSASGEDSGSWTSGGSDQAHAAVRAVAVLYGETLPALIAADWAEHALPTWQAKNQDDARPRRAIAAARAWASCPCEDHRRAAAAWAAVAQTVPSGVNASAAQAAAAAAHAASTAITAVAHAVAAARGSAASAAVPPSRRRRPEKALADALHGVLVAARAARAAEEEWQRLRLAAYALGEAKSANPDRELGADPYAQAVVRALRLEGFRYQRHETFSLGLQTNEVALFVHERTGLVFCLVPGGTFLMGSPEEEAESSDDERPQHEVSLEPFLLCQTLCTQEAWERVASQNPAQRKGPQRPIETVSWDDVRQWLENAGGGLRLPSEAEWEYSCRAGTTTPFAFGQTITTDQVNFNGKSPWAKHPYGDGRYRGDTTDAGSFPPNAFGLFDVHGNVFEWCQDRWHTNYHGAPADGSAWEDPGSGLVGGGPQIDPGVTSGARVTRGGSMHQAATYCRSGERSSTRPDLHVYDHSFRPARSL